MPLRPGTHENPFYTNTLTTMLLKPAPAICTASKHCRYRSFAIYKLLPGILLGINDC
jgi:hypothetical protein